jgi:hypothetical protein
LPCLFFDIDPRLRPVLQDDLESREGFSVEAEKILLLDFRQLTILISAFDAQDLGNVFRYILISVRSLDVNSRGTVVVIIPVYVGLAKQHNVFWFELEALTHFFSFT